MQTVWQALRTAFHDSSSVVYRRLHSAIYTLIVFSIALFFVELGLDEGHPALPVLWAIDTGVLLIFVLEITLRIGTHQPPELDFFDHTPQTRLATHIKGRLLYCLEPWNMIDILTVLALVPVLRGLRALRLLRLLSNRRFFRYSHPLLSVARMFHENRLLYTFAFSMLGFLTLVGGLSIFLVERGKNEELSSVADGIWWAIVTLTTVGFGDITPVTPVGRVVGGALMIGGMFTLALFAGIVGHTLLRAVLTIREEQYRMSTFLNHIVICGYDAGAAMLLNALLSEYNANEKDFLIFSRGDRPSDLPPQFIWVDGDPTKESELDKVRMSHAESVIIVGSREMDPQQADANTILTAFTIRSYLTKLIEKQQRKKDVYVVAEILDAENVQHARTAGCDEVIETTRVGFSLVVHAVKVHGTAHIMSDVAAAGSMSLYVGVVPEHIELPVDFGSLSRQVKEEAGALVIGIRHKDAEHDVLNPPDSRQVTGDCGVIYLAETPVLEDWQD